VSDPLERLSGESKSTDKDCPLRHLELDPETEGWLRGQEQTVETRLRWARLREQRAQTYGRLVEATRDDRERPVLVALHREGGTCTYEDVLAWANYTKRTARRAAERLDEDGVVTQDYGRPTVLSYPDEGVAVLAEDALSLWFSSE
jgi:hypothetical protein